MKLEDQKAIKAQKARYQVNATNWRGSNPTSDEFKRGATASAYIGGVRKIQKKGSKNNRPKWQRFRIANDLTVVTDAESPASPRSDNGNTFSFNHANQSPSSVGVTSPRSSQHSPYAAISPSNALASSSNQSLLGLQTRSSGSLGGNPTLEVVALPIVHGIIKPSTISKRMTDAIRYNLTNAGIRVVKRSRKHRSSNKSRTGGNTSSTRMTKSGASISARGGTDSTLADRRIQ